MSRWKNIRYRLERGGLELLAWFIPRLPRRVCVWLSAVCGEIAFACDGQGRAVAEENLECAFGERYSPRQRRQIARASYRNFARTMLDLFWAQNLTAENYRDYLHLEGFEAVRERHASSPGGSIAITVHLGNWEWAGLALGFAGIPTFIVAENFKNPLLSETFHRLREVSGNTIIAQERSILRLLKTVHRGGAAGMLIDLSLYPTQAATVIEGFGMKMCVTLLHAVLAQRAGTILVPLEAVPLPDGTCRVIAHPSVDFPEGSTPHEIAQRCWDAFDPLLRANPERWLWPYKHFRYRPRAAAEPYPAYANDSPDFDKLLRAIAKEEVANSRSS
ncbi:MAG: lysophospholipid acyltransferase family protein [Chthoniobacterales bacterium]|nr:lysophospholipid acyltransferase family protein [Chthoniobacterales bacterium]